SALERRDGDAERKSLYLYAVLASDGAGGCRAGQKLRTGRTGAGIAVSANVVDHVLVVPADLERGGEKGRAYTRADGVVLLPARKRVCHGLRRADPRRD